MKISKKILSEVLNVNVCSVERVVNNIVRYKTTRKHISGGDTITKEEINIYELAHKCKEWISSSRYVYIEDTRGYSKVSNLSIRKFWEDEEYNLNRIFDACEWILENR